MPHRKPHFLGELYERNKRTLLGYLSRRVGRENAPDLLQETFVRFIQNYPVGAIANAPPLLQQIAINLARDHARRRKIEAKYLEFGDLPEDVPSTEPQPGARLEAEENGRLLCEVINSLPPRCREVLLLHIYQKLPLAEIAKRLGISSNMAQKHMRLALLRCFAALD
ncbi:MAG TPA: RNA polymerase sigma factor [Methylocella sp.]|nr:RNA polymerase sigma factor [Methylocella sp.]